MNFERTLFDQTTYPDFNHSPESFNTTVCKSINFKLNFWFFKILGVFSKMFFLQSRWKMLSIKICSIWFLRCDTILSTFSPFVFVCILSLYLFSFSPFIHLSLFLLQWTPLNGITDNGINRLIESLLGIFRQSHQLENWLVHRKKGFG